MSSSGEVWYAGWPPANLDDTADPLEHWLHLQYWRLGHAAARLQRRWAQERQQWQRQQPPEPEVRSDMTEQFHFELALERSLASIAECDVDTIEPQEQQQVQLDMDFQIALALRDVDDTIEPQEQQQRQVRSDIADEQHHYEIAMLMSSAHNNDTDTESGIDTDIEPQQQLQQPCRQPKQAKEKAQKRAPPQRNAQQAPQEQTESAKDRRRARMIAHHAERKANRQPVLDSALFPFPSNMGGASSSSVSTHISDFCRRINAVSAGLADFDAEDTKIKVGNVRMHWNVWTNRLTANARLLYAQDGFRGTQAQPADAE